MKLKQDLHNVEEVMEQNTATLKADIEVLKTENTTQAQELVTLKQQLQSEQTSCNTLQANFQVLEEKF